LYDISECVNYKKGCTRLAAVSDKVYQLLAHGRWFSSGTQAFSTTKNGCHDIAAIDININCIICDMQNKKNKKMKTRGCMGMVIYDSCEICGEVKCDHYCLNTAYDRLIDYKNSHGCSC
jgi:hypothetical protein